MEKKNMAILFSGIHYMDSYHHFTNKNIKIDYREYIKNIKTKIYGHFEKEYTIDTFFSTNNSIYLNDLINTYKPIAYDSNEYSDLLKDILPNNKINKNNNSYKKLKALRLLTNHILETNKNYDLILLTRFDIYIVKELTNVDINKFNIVSIVDNEFMCDDNLYIFPIHYLNTFFNIFVTKCIVFETLFKLNKPPIQYSMLGHYLKNDIEKNMQVNYICNDKYNPVHNLTFFKLRFFNDIDLIINKYLFTENVTYYSKNKTASILINDEIIFEKINKNQCQNAFFGYELESKKYNVSFEIYSDNTIEFDFIKIDDEYHKTKCIVKNTWTKIEICIDIKKIFLFIFDSFNDSIKIKCKNMKFNIIE
jgi:hypothetical protein